MDLYAYSQIDDLKEVAEKNSIEVPRLRGYRLMSEEPPITSTAIAETLKGIEMDVYERACTSCPRFKPDSHHHEYSTATDRLQDKYLIKEERRETLDDGTERVYEETVGFRWNLIHGKNKKALKLAIKQKKKRVLKSIETFNKYARRSDVLYIHARIGGGNWFYFKGYELEKEPWFLEKVDDWFDDTYCDIYAVIDGGKAE